MEAQESRWDTLKTDAATISVAQIEANRRARTAGKTVRQKTAANSDSVKTGETLREEDEVFYLSIGVALDLIPSHVYVLLD
jgi:hypothetical protein